MSALPQKANTFSVIVTFYPDQRLFALVEALVREVAHIVIVDNFSQGTSLETMAQLARFPEVTVLHQSENLGLATGLNRGIEFAYSKGAEWVLLFDQDSQILPGILEELSAAVKDYRGQSKFPLGIIGANYAEFIGDRQSENARGWTPVITVISAGSLISREIWKHSGPLWDDLFIDHIDHEYCLRLRKQGFAIIKTKKKLFIHSVGLPEKVQMIGRTFYPMNQSPQRWYFSTRNLVWLFKKYGWREKRFFIREGDTLLRRSAKTVLAEHLRPAKALSALRGLLSGLFQRHRDGNRKS